MKKYSDYPENEKPWTKYKIVVPTEEDRQELMKGFEHIHYSDVDTENIVVNQLIHEYLDEERMDGAKNNIIVDSVLYNKLTNNLIGKTLDLDLGSSSPVTVTIKEITDTKVIVDYKNSTPGRFEEFSIDNFEYFSGIKIK
jgi:light-regulated signal transduction histidine kinase (bacteriophytochrome)